MSTIKITELPASPSLSQNTVLPSVTDNATYKVTLEDLNIIQKTKAEIDTLITNSQLIPGQLYKITGVDPDLYGGTDILINAATTNELELAGHGIFYNPKYITSIETPNNGYGIWTRYMFPTISNITGGDGRFFTGQTITADNGATAIFLTNTLISWVSGDWSSATTIANGAVTADISGAVSPSYPVSSSVIWGGKHWINTSGNVGTSTDKFTLSSSDWTVVPFNDTDYNVVIDIINYDYENNTIIRRKDKWNNDIDISYRYINTFSGNCIKDFQWGNAPEDHTPDSYEYIGVIGNYVKDSYLECINFIGEYIHNNTLTQGSAINDNITDIYGSISENTLSQYSGIYDNIFTGDSYTIYNNTLIDFSGISKTTSSNSYIWGNTLDESGIGGPFGIGNTFNDNTQIYGNILTFNANIFENYCDNATIMNNKLNSGFIRGNNIIDSYIESNVLDNGSNIGFNSLNNADIGYNTFNNSDIGGRNFSFGIENNFTNVYIQFNNINNRSKIINNVFEGSLNNGFCFIEYNKLNNSTFNFGSSGTLTSKNIRNIDANYANATFNISSSTTIYGDYSKQMFRNSAGTTRLGYYNASDVFTVVNVNA